MYTNYFVLFSIVFQTFSYHEKLENSGNNDSLIGSYTATTNISIPREVKDITICFFIKMHYNPKNVLEIFSIYNQTLPLYGEYCKYLYLSVHFEINIYFRNHIILYLSLSLYIYIYI